MWGWLVGPFVDAWLKVYPDDKAGARKCLEGFEAHLERGGVGTLSEIFDAEAPYTPRGCIAQAWTVAEVLRAWLLTEPTDLPHPLQNLPSSLISSPYRAQSPARCAAIARS